VSNANVLREILIETAIGVWKIEVEEDLYTRDSDKERMTSF